MGKIIESIRSAYAARADDASARPTVSFEFFPAKTNAGVFNLLTRVEEMGLALQPTFVTLTWRSAFKDEALWLRIGAHIQNEFQLDVLLHLTCHLPTEQLKRILKNARAAGIRNILALRGDPPIGAERWSPVEGGLSNAVDLIKLIREEHGDYFCIACAGYAEVHTESWNHPDLPPSNEARALDLQRLKAKQDAGADFIITQFFFDVDNMIQWISDCKDAGITIPILPGYLPIQNYSSFCKFTSWCKTRVPEKVLTALDAIKNDDAAVRRYGTQLAVETCRRLLAAGVNSLHFYTMNLATTVTQVLEGLQLLPARNQRELPWQSTLQRSTVEGEQVRPIFWSNRQASYIARTAAWDEFPNGRWGDRTSPAYGELSEYYLAFKRPKLQRTELWGTPQTEEDVWNVFVRFIDGHVKQLPWCEQALSLESAAIRENLQWLNSNGFLTINSQPRVNGAPSSDPSVGWGGDDGVVFQKAYVEFFVAPEKIAHLVKVMRRDYPQLSFHALNRRGDEHRNTPLHSVTAVTWGVFPGIEIVQPTVVDSDSFAAWKDEAFELWQTQWASAYPEGSCSREVIQHIYDSYFLVNIVDNDYANDDSDIFSIFTRIITEAMDKEELRTRVLELEARREKMFDTLASFQSLQKDLNGELRAAHSELAGVRGENLQLKEKVRQLEAQLALASL
ncbi:methylenetetrahydrofolate reductase [Phytophthora nicotianae CJ01A1]|uniref:Methylenetetrahydrofolate reductase n=5 Tax=Phytophthora nicotianae TaxID=4792 RepID=W2QTM7_PHYN3|nr:methylenetetrahydrofolate reductase [Phytophthora nicotianae INRA-310]ETI55584.1 methylenetetrahydrofolate reductase [Phytophthora nicotianae P1569]ETK95374.1 methylenetetrahydrofolate reductase [Phytophthora nicotianae]ETO84299.1 methylenetetrahydrofolate reductase [Phytophthora nicotianae P1976]ETP25389.1 methylenetetrahydrofolate reductase [Phytophthora nicotianae CJ01A1]KUF97921.1 Methylenetetrahydrofolate reductase [Phytophthora nicotianae]